MTVYRTAMGKKLDMGALMAKNEKARAVSNAKLNARGDVIDAQGKIVQSANNRVSKLHNNTVGNKSANVVKNSNALAQQPVQNQSKEEILPTFELTESEKELENEFDDGVEVEKIKEKEVKNGSKTAVRRTQS